MDSIVEAKVKGFLQHDLEYSPYECGTIVECINALARVAGYNLDDRFGRAGPGAGPEARVASGIVDRALLGGGAETSDYEMEEEIDRWTRLHWQKSL